LSQRGISRAVVVATWLVGIVLNAHAAAAAPAGKTRTYYVAADEVQWDYAPSGRDEAMGMDFDDIEKAITQSGPHRIGRVYKKAVYHEYTDATFSTLKMRVPDEQYLGILGPILRLRRASPKELQRVQQRREFPTRVTQWFQVQVQRRVLSRTIRSQVTPKAPLILHLLNRWKWLRQWPARFVGIGVRPERVDRRIFKHGGS